MKVLVFIPSLPNTSPGSRFRIEQWAPHLEREGFRFTFASFEGKNLHRCLYQQGRYLRKALLFSWALFRRVCLLSLVRNYDVIFVYEEAARVGPPIIERLIRWFRVPIIYDFCDPIYLPYISPVNGYFSYLKCFSKYSQICQLSNQVIVGNQFLADFARRYNSNVTIIPLTIDTHEYQVQEHKPQTNGKVVVGWSGSLTTASHLKFLEGSLKQLADQLPYHLQVIGTQPPRLSGISTSYTPWCKDTEVRDLQALDIGIMPLPDDPWTRLRTQLKVRQYMGVGVPTIASPVGIIPELIQDGINGFLADSPKDWVEKLRSLIENIGLRERLGLAGRQTIEAHYSTQHWLPRIRSIFEAAAAGRRN